MFTAYKKVSSGLKRPKSSAVAPFEEGDSVVPGSAVSLPPGELQTATDLEHEHQSPDGYIRSPADEDCQEASTVCEERARLERQVSDQAGRIAEQSERISSQTSQLAEQAKRIGELEAALSQERASAKLALEEAEAKTARLIEQAVREQRALWEREAPATPAGAEPPRCAVCGKPEDKPAGGADTTSLRSGSKNRPSRRVGFVDSDEVISVQCDGELKRNPRNRTNTGKVRINFDSARAIKRDSNGQDDAADSEGAHPRGGDGAGAEVPGVGSDTELRKPRERVPTGYMSVRDLFQNGLMCDDDEARGDPSSDDEGPSGDNGSAVQRGRVSREPTQSCHVLIDFKQRGSMGGQPSGSAASQVADKDVDGGVTVVPPPAMRRRSHAESSELVGPPCKASKEPASRRASSIASFATFSLSSGPLLGTVSDVGGGSSGSTTSGARSGANRGSTASRRVSFSGTAGSPKSDSNGTIPESPHETEAVGSAPQEAQGPTENRGRRMRQKTHSLFVSQDVLAEVLHPSSAAAGPEPAQGARGTAAAPPQAEDRGAPDAAEAPAAPEEGEAQPEARPSYKRDSIPAAGGSPCHLSAADNEEHLNSLARYGLWRRQLQRRTASGATEGGGSKEPPGTLVKGVHTLLKMTHADMSLLAEAMPMLLNTLNVSPEIMAHSFLGYNVEAGEEFWREDAVIEHVYILGEGASLALSRGGRPLRDVGPGQCLGTEALSNKCRWSCSATAKRAGEVWVVDATVFRDLVSAAANEAAFKDIVTTLGNGPAFKPVLPMQLILLAAHADAIELRKEECLFRNGEEGSTYFVLKQGGLAVVKDGHTLRRYTRNSQSFGEYALLDSVASRRSATVVAAEPSSVLALSADLLRTVFGDGLGAFLHQSIVRQFFRDNDSADSRFADLRTETMELWADKCVVHTFGPGEDILEKAGGAGESGGLELTGMLVVIAGEVHHQACGASPGMRSLAPYILGQDHLVEKPCKWLQSLTSTEGGATIATLPSTRHAEVFEHCEDLSELLSYQRRVTLVRNIFIFRHLSEEQCGTLVKSMTFCTKKKGEVIVKEGDSGAEFFIIHEGDVSVSKNHNFITKLSQPAYFGERALLYEEPRAATITVASEEATCCVLTKSIFLEVLHGGILDFITYRNKLLDTDLQFSDLEEQKIIGRGGYGTVKLVRHRSSGTRYALKCVTRAELSEQDRNLVQRERAILQLIDHPFCLKLVRSFKDDKSVYFLTELVTGGELLDALDRLDVLDRPQAQFYLGSLLIVFEYIHEKNVVYRDLKPENVLLDEDGFIKLIDFGAARRLDTPAQKCYTLLGTPHFMAAEMILGNGYGMPADMWAMGVCLYEFMVGRLPFDGDKPVSIFRQVASKKPVWVPEDVDPASADMLRWLLQKDPADRAQSSTKGYKAVREHPFFQDFNWTALINRTMRPPYVPQGEQYSEDVACSEGAADPSAGLARPYEGGPTAAGPVSGDGWDAEF